MTGLESWYFRLYNTIVSWYTGGERTFFSVEVQNFLTFCISGEPPSSLPTYLYMSLGFAFKFWWRVTLFRFFFFFSKSRFHIRIAKKNCKFRMMSSTNKIFKLKISYNFNASINASVRTVSAKVKINQCLIFIEIKTVFCRSRRMLGKLKSERGWVWRILCVHRAWPSMRSSVSKPSPSLPAQEPDPQALTEPGEQCEYMYLWVWVCSLALSARIIVA